MPLLKTLLLDFLKYIIQENGILTNEFGNPTGLGAGKSWPTNFPIRFADIRGDLTSDLNYNVIHKGDSYIPFPSQYLASLNLLMVKLMNFLSLCLI